MGGSAGGVILRRTHYFESSGHLPYIPSAFFPVGASPLPTSPFSLRSIYQLSVDPSLFFSVNANIALPFLTASLRSAASEWRELLIASKAADDGKASELYRHRKPPSRGKEALYVPFFRDIVGPKCELRIWTIDGISEVF